MSFLGGKNPHDFKFRRSSSEMGDLLVVGALDAAPEMKVNPVTASDPTSNVIVVIPPRPSGPRGALSTALRSNAFGHCCTAICRRCRRGAIIAIKWRILGAVAWRISGARPARLNKIRSVVQKPHIWPPTGRISGADGTARQHSREKARPQQR